MGDGKLIIATAQTLQQNLKYINMLTDLVGLVVIDEAHHFPAPLFNEVAGRFKAQYMLGLTATPDRKDGLESIMYLGIGPKLHTIDRGNLYDDGQLIKPEIHFIFTQFGNDKASTVTDEGAVDAGGEDLNYQELIKELVEDKDRLNLVAKNIAENWRGNYSIVIAENVRYSFYLMKAVAEYCRVHNLGLPKMNVVHGRLSAYTATAPLCPRSLVDDLPTADRVEHLRIT
jgi:superfamily II DNA or RNA helicase